ncbi:MAG TPA: GAF domain-containing sensor histidine kinase [Gemmatimonadales bacterium]|jgi:signal transduction histidine kinase|nr:GAF domain-containing sensor histidine kinase [Gemmatimonadales bacterium]
MTDAQPQPIAISEDRLKTLIEIGLLLTSELSLDGLLQRLAEHSARLLGARYAAIGVLNRDGTGLAAFYTHGIDDPTRARIGNLPQGHGILGFLIREPKVVRLPDLGRHPSSYGFPANHPKMTSFLGAPIVGRRGVFGNIYLTEKIDAAEFTDEDEGLIVLLAAQAAAAVDNARLHEDGARLLEEVQTLHRSRERFFAMVNHELRNALAATYGWAEMLTRKKDPATVPRAAYEVLEAAGQAIALISDLLDLSRLDEDRLRPVIQAVEPEAMVRRTMARLTPMAEAKRITQLVEAKGILPIIKTDSNRVEQILVNLLSNGIRHSPEGGKVWIEILERDERIRFEVRNDGPSIPESEAEQIFDIYVTKAGEESRGSGLGLPLSRRLARLLGGELKVLAGTGEGACFVLELPKTIN